MPALTIPDSLIKRLQGLGPHFCLVKAHDKDPSIGGKGWQLPENLMFADDPRLQTHLISGGNYGVVGGFGLVIADADTQELRSLFEEKLPETFTVESPGSHCWHAYFLCGLENPIRLRDKDRANVGDLQGPGKMVVGPNSIHPNGGVYKVVKNLPLAQVTAQELREALKEWIVPEKEINQVEAAAKRESRESNIELDILRIVPLSGLHRRGSEYFGPHPIHKKKKKKNFWVNSSKNCWHCFRHGSGGGPLLWLAVEEGIIDCADARAGALRGEIFKRTLKRAEEKGFIDISAAAVKSLEEDLNHIRFFDIKGRFIPKLLAEEVMENHHFVTMMDNQEIYVYLDGFYQPYGEILVKQECKHKLQEFYRKNRTGEVIDYIKTSTFTKRREEPPNLLPLENGVLDISSMEIQPYSPDLMFFNKIPVKYDPQATCPKIDTFHNEITNRREDVTILEEVIGFCLNRDYFMAKALMLVGGGSNGKSTWLSLVKRFLGLENVCGRSLQDLEEHRFAKADLHTKLANIYADLPDKALYKTGTFKMLTGRDLITAEHKFQRAFHFVNYAKLLFSANKVPEAYDDTNAFFRRWIIIIFPNEFIPGNGADPHILEKITTEEELSGLLNKVLVAIKRLQKNGHFSHSKTTEEIREDYIRKSSPIAAFIMDCLETDSDAFIAKKALYNEFAEYCRGRSLPTVVQDTFFKNLPQHTVISDFRPRIEGKGRFTSFKGLRYKANGWSNRSKRSRVFYTLIEKSKEYEAPYKIVEIEDKNYIKIELALDSPDRPDQKDPQQALEDALATHCHLCKEHLPKVEEYKRIDGKPVCEKCFKDTQRGREERKQCRNLQKEDEEYVCNWGDSPSGLQGESLCGPDCDGWEVS